MYRYLTHVVFTFAIAISLPLLARFRRSRKPTAKGLFVVSESQKLTQTSRGTEFDIIAVHGLGANPWFTWTCRSEPSSSLNQPKGKRVAWLRDFLPGIFPACRILRFAYNADWLFRAPFKTSHESAKFLLEQINKDRAQGDKIRRPIIFVAHSYGGIIVKDALVLAKLFPKFEGISAATAGVIFLGTPHKGSNISAIGSFCARLASPILGSSAMLIKSLGYHSSDLYDRHEMFLQSNVNHIKLCCYFERIPTSILGIPLGLIVDEVSATMDDKQIPRKAVNRDHSDLNKFADQEDEAFIDLCDTLKDMMKSAGEFPYVKQSREQDVTKTIIAHCQAHRDTMRRKCNAISQLHLATPPRVKWFLESRQYWEWTSTPSSGSSMAGFLWYTGRPNSGKSAALSYVVKQLEASTASVDTVYFFGPTPSAEKPRFARPQVKVADILGSLISQLARCDSVNDIGKRLSSLSADDRKRLHSIFDPVLELSPQMLWELFDRLLRCNMARRVLVIIDGLDAIQPEEDRNAFVRHLRDFWNSLSLEVSATTKFLVSSLPYDPIRQAFSHLPFIDPVTEVTACLDSLKSLAANTRQENIARAQADTGGWIDSMPAYQSWNNEKRSQAILLLGKAGSGKSTLLSKLLKSKQVEHNAPDLKDLFDDPLQAKRFLPGRLDGDLRSANALGLQTADVAHNGKTIVASFFYSHKLMSETSHEHMLASLLFQILSQEERLIELYQKEYLRVSERQGMRLVEADNALNVTNWQFEDLKAVFSKLRAFAEFPLTIFIIVDGVDESEDSEDRYKLLDMLTHVPATNPPGVTLKTIVASRRLTRQIESADHLHCFLLESENGPDIERIVDTKLIAIRKAVAKLDEEERCTYDIEAFRKIILQKAKGVFLWVSLVLTFVERLFLKGLHTPIAIAEALESPPDDIEELYVAIIKRLTFNKAPDKAKGKVWLQVVSVAVRFLDIKEFADATAVSASQRVTDEEVWGDRVSVSDLEAFQTALINLCGGFLELGALREVRTINPRLRIMVETESDADTSVQLLHRTAKDFLLNSRAGEFQIPLESATRQITDACIRYLRLALSQLHVSKELKQLTESPGVASWTSVSFDIYISYLERRPFLHYVFSCLPVHLEALGADDEMATKLSDAISQIRTEPVSPGRLMLSHWIRHLSQLFSQSLTSRGEQFSSSVLRFWERQVEEDEAALHRDRQRIPSKFLASALESASGAGSLKTVKLLCAVGASEEAFRSGRLSAALDAATKSRHKQRRQIIGFLSHQAARFPDILAHSQKIGQVVGEVRTGTAGLSDLSTALLDAASCGDLATVKLLISEGAAADVRASAGQSALHLAATAGSLEVVRLLTQFGADVQAKDHTGLTPLHAAVMSGNEALVKYLLTTGADPNDRDDRYMSPLRLAASSNREAIVRQLLEFGADDRNMDVDRHLFMVPYPRNAGFVGRARTLEHVTVLFLDPYQTGQSRCALVGLGGIGKSQIALELAYRFREKDPKMAVFWVSAQSKSAFEQSYHAIARRAKLPAWDNPNVNALNLVHDWLDSPESGRWLLVLDNADDAKELKSEYIPTLRGLILITSRNKGLSHQLSNTTVHVDLLTEIEAMQLLLVQSAQPSGAKGDDSEYRQLLQAFDYLPLAIVQAAAFINESSISVSEFYALYKESAANRQELLSTQFDVSGRALGSINATNDIFDLSFQAITERDSLAADFLAFMSMLAPDSIPIYLLPDEDVTKLDLQKAIGHLINFSLIRKNSYQSCDMHRLVQSAMRTRLERQGTLDHWHNKAIQQLATKFPDGSFETWSVCRELLPHANSALEFESSASTQFVEHALLLCKTGAFYMEMGEYAVAKERVKRAFRGLKDSLGWQDPQTLHCSLLLSELLAVEGQLDGAASVISNGLEITRATYGPDHPITREFMRRRVTILIQQGRYEEAQALEDSILHMKAQDLADDDPENLRDMSNLSAIYLRMGRLQEAEDLSTRVVGKKKLVLGEHHPDTLRSMHDLSLIYIQRENLAEAMRLEESVLDARKHILGEEHPDTIKSMEHLASIFRVMGTLKEAMQLSGHARVRAESRYRR